MPRKSVAHRERAVSDGEKGTPAYIAAVVVVGIVAVTGAILFGKSDSGPINVAATIEDSNAVQSAGGGGEPVTASSPMFQSMPNGGLLPQDGQGQPAPEPAPISAEAVSTSTPTSTDEVVSSPDAGEASDAGAAGDEPVSESQ